MEKQFINIIKQTLKSKYIGSDCAYLEDLGITISQDSLVEDVHFLREKITPWQLGYKTAMVNISDICASGAKPKYMTVALSLPKSVDVDFVQKFYNGLLSACGEEVEIVGGDITGGEKIFISATVIGVTFGRNISARNNARAGQKIVVAGLHGSSAAGLYAIQNNMLGYENFIKAHLEPVAQVEVSRLIATSQKTPYAMMDTSDGLMDALSQISEQSNVKMSVDFDKIPFDTEIKNFPNWAEYVLFGGEDYGLVATLDNPPKELVVIGEVLEGSGVELNGQKICAQDIERKIFKHF